ncbi:thioesterase family protein [Acetobacteraceae bacterium KSS8]|uniref:Thioesterase family protein n=1 Tax=Endosaccharibacter trunci TaxID=2812733 RepID=A0ABT1W7U9_9PROT|nr:thioesterase family protein [Acetobacteraceae bacterium KSS8]
MSSSFQPVAQWDHRDITELLRVEPDGTDCFVARRNQPNGNGAVFGGQVLGQSLAAASATVRDRALHSLHGYFLRPGRCDEPVRYRVERTREGRSFTTRRVTGTQGAETIFHMECSFHADEPGWDHQFAIPDVPPPEQLASLDDIAAQLEAGPVRAVLERMHLGFDVRPVDPDHLLTRRHDSTLLLWFRMPNAAEIDDPMVRQHVLAWMSDHWIATAAVVQHKMALPSPDIMIASIDHAMWFHRPCPTGEWLLFAYDSPSAYNGTGLSRALIYAQDGTLVATAVQESLQRPRRRPSIVG